MKKLGAMIQTLRHSIGLIVVLAVFLLISALTPPAPWQTFSGLSAGTEARLSAVDVIETANYLPSRVEKYFNQNFHWRERLVYANIWIRLNLLGEKDFHDVVAGREGWLYYSGEKNLDYYQNMELMSLAQITALLAQLSQTREQLSGQGIAFYVVIAPDKESIYPEYLPSGIQREEGPSLIDRITAQNQDEDLALIDLRPALLAARNNEQVYYRTDTHWNPPGAFAAYREIMRQLGKDFPVLQAHELNEYDRVSEVISGDLSAMLNMKGELVEQSWELEPRFPRRAETTSSEDGSVVTSATGDPNQPRVMIFHDSFYNGLQPFMAEHFQQAILVHSFTPDLEWIKAEKPDLVILEVAERYIPELLRMSK